MEMVMPGERIADEESEDTDATDSVESYPEIASIGDIGKSSDISSPGILSSGYGIVYLPGDINGLAKKLHLLAVEFFAGNLSQGRIGSCIGRVA